MAAIAASSSSSLVPPVAVTGTKGMSSSHPLHLSLSRLHSLSFAFAPALSSSRLLSIRRSPVDRISVRAATEKKKRQNKTQISGVEEEEALAPVEAVQEVQEEVVVAEEEAGDIIDESSSRAAKNGEESSSTSLSQEEIGQALSKLRQEKSVQERSNSQDFWGGVLEETKLVEWPSFQKVLGTTGVVVAIIFGSSLVLLTVNAVLAELSDNVFSGTEFGSSWTKGF
jgi:preprotein translocase SecE subunit